MNETDKMNEWMHECPLNCLTFALQSDTTTATNSLLPAQSSKVTIY